MDLTIDKTLKKVKKIHFIGIGGAGMCPLAEILLSLGYIISGSDNNDTETFRKIESEGATVYLGQKKENIKDDIELVIYTNAISKDNDELVYALQNFPTYERAEALGALSRIFSNCIGVCGTHGKTTTTSMITQILFENGYDPSALIGGKLPIINAYGRYGDSQNFVCESCEFKDTFLHMNADVAVILNVDEDHLDYFKNLDGIKKSFRKFAENTSRTIIFNGDDKNTVDTLKDIQNKELISVGINDSNDYYAKNINKTSTGYYEFDVIHNGNIETHIELSVPGKHNVLNALCAYAASIISGALPNEISNSIKNFGGAARRFEKTGFYNGVTFIDDYAHHPEEIKVTLDSAKDLGFKRIWAVHQPFTYTRTSELLNDFAEVLSQADKCVISEIMGGRETNEIGIKATDLSSLIPDSIQIDQFKDIAKYVTDNVVEGDIVITLGCGDVYKVNRMMCDIMSKK